MMRVTVLVPFVLALTLACSPKTAHQSATPSGVLGNLKHRVDAYAALQQQQLTGTAVARQTDSGAATTEPARVLAERMRTARAGARQGDILSTAIGKEIREALNPEVRGRDAAETRSSIRDDGPGAFKLQINADYPEGAALPMVPPNVLAVLPTLPEGLDWRIVGSHLILRDTRANIIVDYLLNVM